MQRLNNPLTASLIVAILYALFLFVPLSRNAYDFSIFVNAGDRFVDAALAPPGLSILPNSDGYDGQFYYRLALTPFTNRQTDRGITIDTPAYRQQRIIYPLLARALSLGRPAAVPAALVLVNLLALSGIAYLGALYARGMGRGALWGVALALYPGFLMTLSRDTTEIVAAFFVVAFVVAMQRERFLLAGAGLALAVLSKETTLLAAAAVGLVAVIETARTRQLRPLARWLPALIPPAAYLLWQAWLANTWRMASVTGHTFSNNIGLPFAGVLGLARALWPPLPGHVERVWLAELALLALFIGVCLLVLRRSRAAPFLKIAWLLHLALALSLTRTVWVEDWAYLRVLPEVYLFGAMILLAADTSLRKVFLVLAPAAWAALAFDLLFLR